MIKQCGQQYHFFPVLFIREQTRRQDFNRQWDMFFLSPAHLSRAPTKEAVRQLLVVIIVTLIFKFKFKSLIALRFSEILNCQTASNYDEACILSPRTHLSQPKPVFYRPAHTSHNPCSAHEQLQPVRRTKIGSRSILKRQATGRYTLFSGVYLPT